jgi:hypothetical protein
MKDRKNREISRMLKECDELNGLKKLSPEKFLQREHTIEMLWRRPITDEGVATTS